MNKRVIVYVLGAVLLIEAALMLLPLLVAVIYREKNGWYFLWVLLGAAVLGALAVCFWHARRLRLYLPVAALCTVLAVGLALCAQIAEAFGTQMTFASRVGEGTTVTILLQKEAEHEEAAQQQ